jgi:adenine-specific DNA-methyltransferase
MTTSSVPIETELLPERRKKDSASLKWDSKPKRAPNPKDIEFQTAEIVIPNPNRDQQRLSTFFPDISRVEIDRTRMNRLIWGDNLLAMQALLASGYAEQLKLIYIDPPFWTGENYYSKVKVNGEDVTKAPSVIEKLAYKDYWEGGVDSYLDMLFPRLHLMKKLLRRDGAIFVHIDWHIGHYAKVLMDEVFGADNFRNEIQVKRIRKNVQEYETVKRLNVANDTILLYGRTDAHRILQPRKEGKLEERWHAFDAPGLRQGMDYQLFGKKPPPGRHWMWSKDRADESVKNGQLRPSQTTGRPEYLVESAESVVTSTWDDISAYAFGHGFQTEKSERLLGRIIEMSSEKGELVADFFCGSGTTMVVAEELGRRWIGCDFTKTAIQIARNRLVGMDSHPFLLENIGNYQRHMIYLSGGRIFEMQHIVLKLYGAMPRKDFPELGTKRDDDGVNELVYVGYPDRAVTAKKTEELAHLAENLDGSGYRRLVILGWDYEYNYEELLAPIMAPIFRRTKIDLRKRTIPPEVYEYLKSHSSSEDIDNLAGKVVFHDKPYLKLLKPRIERSKGQAKVNVGIERYILYDLPLEDQKQKDEVQEIVKKNFAALLDYWAVDWEYDGITFKSSWQAFRGFGKDIKQVPLSTIHNLSTGKKYTIAVRAVDIFGNDATGTCTADLR